MSYKPAKEAESTLALSNLLFYVGLEITCLALEKIACQGYLPG